MKRLQRHRESLRSRISGRSVSKAIRSGFTLLEVMLVMAILIVLAGISASFLLNASDDALDDAAMAKALEVQNLCKRFKIKALRFPTSPEELITRPADLNKNKWRRPYAEKLPVDPWNNPFRFERDQGDSNIIHVTSAGANGTFGDGDDISTRDN